MRDFAFEPGLEQWDAEREVPGWGGTLRVCIEAPAGGPSRRQMDVLQAILSYPGDLRAETERRIFDHYKRDVEGTTGYTEHGVDVTDLRAPRLHSPGEVWRLLHCFSIFIPPLRPDGSAVVFELHLECSWDRDHGLCVLFRDWVAESVAGQTDCRGSDMDRT